jgi:3' exoribonuclease family, domain 1
MVPHILKPSAQKSHARCGFPYGRHAPLAILNWPFPLRYGPRQSKSSAYHEVGRLSVEVKFAPFSSLVRRVPIRVRQGQQYSDALSPHFVTSQDAEDRSIANLVQQALASSVRLDLLPKSVIDIFITVIEYDGIESCVAAATVTASTSLAKAGIEMLGLVVSCAGVSPCCRPHLYFLTVGLSGCRRRGHLVGSY